MQDKNDAVFNYAWLIWSNEHSGWWKPNHRGYTENRQKAGRYAYAEAIEIVFKANRHLNVCSVANEAMVRDESFCCRAPMVNGGVQCEACGSNGL